MFKNLNDSQRAFLEYIQLYHKSMGWPKTVSTILRCGSYEESDMALIVRDFRVVRNMGNGHSEYGKPFKYLKG